MRLIVKYKNLSNCSVNLPKQLANSLSVSHCKPKSFGLILSWVCNDATKKKNDKKSGGKALQALVGWSGSCTGSKDVLEISALFAEALGLQEGQAVGVEPAEGVPTATMIMVEPASEDDWEVIELHSQFLEERLLSQVQLVFEGETLPLWVLGDTLAYVRVTKVVGADITPKTRGFARIAQDGQVVIAPKPRSVLASGGPMDDDSKIRVWLRTCHMQEVSQLLSSEALGDVNGPAGYVACVGPQHAEMAGKYFVAKTRSHEFCNDGSRKVSIREHRAVLRVEVLGRMEDGKVALSPEAEYALECKGTHQIILLDEVLTQPLTCRVDKVVLQEIKGRETRQANLVGDTVNTAIVAFKEWFTDNIGKFPEPIPISPIFVIIARDGSENPIALYSSSIHAATQFVVSNVQSTISPAHDTFHPDISRYTESRMGGYAQEFQDALVHCELCAAVQLRKTGCRGMGLPAPGGLLVAGTRGVGKTTFALTLAEKLCSGRDSAYVVHVPCTRLASAPPVSRSESPMETITRLLWECVRNAPAVIVLDDIDALVPSSGSEEETQSVVEVQVAQQMYALLNCAREVYAESPVAVIATAQSATSMSQLLQGISVFEKVVELMPPSKSARKEILACALCAIAPISAEEASSVVSSAVLATEGYVAADLVQVAERAVRCAACRGAPAAAVAQEDLDSALSGFTPLNLMGTKAVVSTDVAWDDVGGLESVKRTLKETLEWPARYPALFESCPIRLRSGILLYGPPGCGKTMLAQAVATECALNFISVKGPELLSKYIGQSELAVRDLFRRARAAKPSILFFDEFDALAPRRGHDTTGVTDRVVNQLLTQLDGVEALTGVYVLAASSRPDLIDPALLRPGRIDLSLYCGFPGKDELTQILGAMTRKMPLAAGVSLERIGEWCAGRDYTPADLRAALYSAQLSSVKKVISESGSNSNREEGGNVIFDVVQGQDNDDLVGVIEGIYANDDEDYDVIDEKKGGAQLEITEDEIMYALETTRPSISPSERKRYNRIYTEFIKAKTGVNDKDDSDKAKAQIQTLA